MLQTERPSHVYVHEGFKVRKVETESAIAEWEATTGRPFDWDAALQLGPDGGEILPLLPPPVEPAVDYAELFKAGPDALWLLPDQSESAVESLANTATAQWIGEFNAELIAAEVPENVREFALMQAISKHFERSHVLLGKAAI